MLMNSLGGDFESGWSSVAVSTSGSDVASRMEDRRAYTSRKNDKMARLSTALTGYPQSYPQLSSTGTERDGQTIGAIRAQLVTLYGEGGALERSTLPSQIRIAGAFRRLLRRSLATYPGRQVGLLPTGELAGVPAVLAHVLHASHRLLPLDALHQLDRRFHLRILAHHHEHH